MLRVRGLVEGADGDLGAWALRLRGVPQGVLTRVDGLASLGSKN